MGASGADHSWGLGYAQLDYSNLGLNGPPLMAPTYISFERPLSQTHERRTVPHNSLSTNSRLSGHRSTPHVAYGQHPQFESPHSGINYGALDGHHSRDIFPQRTELQFIHHGLAAADGAPYGTSTLVALPILDIQPQNAINQFNTFTQPNPSLFDSESCFARSHPQSCGSGHFIETSNLAGLHLEHPAEDIFNTPETQYAFKFHDQETGTQWQCNGLSGVDWMRYSGDGTVIEPEVFTADYSGSRDGGTANEGMKFQSKVAKCGEFDAEAMFNGVGDVLVKGNSGASGYNGSAEGYNFDDWMNDWNSLDPEIIFE